MHLYNILKRDGIGLLKRRDSRENAFIIIFESFFLNAPADQLIKLSTNFSDLEFDSYSSNLVFGVLKHRDLLNKKIEIYLKNWEIKRISQVLLAILEISFYEILFVEDVDGPVSINAAVELSKKSFGGDGPAFVNGVLGNFLKSI